LTGQTKEEAEKEGTHCVFRYLDRIVVKGRTQPVDVYEIMGLEDALDEQNFEWKEHFEKGIDYYKNKDWEQAIACFENSKKNELEKNIPSQKSTLIRTNPSLVYLARCPMMKKNPPGADWDGVYLMKTK
jgi:adenylate cyclase